MKEEATRVKPLFARLSTLLVGVALLTTAVGCTDEANAPQPTRADHPAASPSTPAPPPSVPLKVVVTRVLGTLPAGSRPALEANVGQAVSAYVDGAFLSGDYPRSDFGASFSSFTRGAATDARRDRDLLTNHELGPTTESVRATRRTAYLSVLAPHKVAAGVTAKVDLVFVVDRGDQPAQRVRLAGRLLLTRTGDGGDWSIFGYDLHRSATPRSAS
jgi:hypothetical protein